MDALRQHPREPQTRPRLEFIDVARGIGIFFVLLGHNLWARSRGSAVIFNFHMPLFFFLSGLFFSPEKARTWAGILEKVVSILAPVPFFALRGGMVFLAQPELAGECSKKTLYGLFVHGEPWYDKPLWFFTSLAGVVLAFSYASRLLSGTRRTFRIGLFFATCLALSFASAATPPVFRKLWSPAMLPTIPLGLFWYGLGHFSRPAVGRLERNRTNAPALLTVAAVLGLVLLFLSDVATKPDLRTARIGSWLLFPRSVLGISAVLLAARAVPNRIGRPVAFVGRNSAAFFALEFATFPFVAKALGILVPGYRHFMIAERTDLWQSLVAVAAQLAVLTALSPLVMATLSRLRHGALFALLPVKNRSDPTLTEYRKPLAEKTTK